MTIDEILEMWEVDSKIEPTDLASESINIPRLHSKYSNIFIAERLRLRKLEAEFKQLKLDKYEFYTQGPNEETQKKGWKFPAKGLILKADIPMYMDADPEMVELSLRIGYQQEKVDFLNSIINTFKNRNFEIKNAIMWHQFTNAVGG